MIRKFISRYIPHKIKRCIKDKIYGYFKDSYVTIEKPIFIWGIGRSGTHLLYDIMSLHPDLCFMKANHRWKKGLWGDMHYGDTTPEGLSGFPIPIEGMQSIWESAGVIPKFYGILKKGDSRYINKRVVVSNYMKLATQWKWKKRGKKYRILDKTPTYIMMVEVIDEIFPDSYHIFCIRDPRAVVNSILRMMRFSAKETSGKEYADGFFAHIYPDGFERYIKKPLVETLCWQVEQMLKIGFRYRLLLGQRLIPFRYEELLTNVRNAISYLYNKVELASFEEIYELIPSSLPDYSPKWPKRGVEFVATWDVCFSSDELVYF